MNLAMLQYIQLSQPRLVEGVACCMYDVTQPVLLRQHGQRFQQTFHGLSGLIHGRTKDD